MPESKPSLFPTFRKAHLWLTEQGSLSLRHLGSAFLGGAIILGIAVAFLGVAGHGQALNERHTRAAETLRRAQDAEKTVATLAATQRNHLLTRQPASPAEVHRQRVECRAVFAGLLASLPDQPATRDRVRAIHAQLQLWLNEIALPESTSAAPGRSAVARPPLPSPIQQAQAALAAITQEFAERSRVLEGDARTSRILQSAGIIFIAVVASVFLVLFSLGSYRSFSTELQRVQGALAQTHAILATTLDGVVMIDDQGLIRSINPAAEKMFDQTAAAVLDKNISVLIPQRLFFHDMASMGRGSIVVVGQRMGYYPFPIEISLSAIEVNGRRQFCALIRDVTDRKRGEETLKHIGLGVSASTGEEFVRSLLKQLSKALEHERAFLVELTGPVGTPTALLTIAEKGELRATVSYDLAHSASASVITGGFRAYLECASATFPEDTLLTESEAQAFIGMPLTDHAGEPIGVMGIVDRRPIDDIGIIESTLQIFAARAAAEIERKRYEGALAAEKERLTVTLRSIGDGCISLDNAGRILMINPVAERLTGWHQSEAVSQDLGEILHLLDARSRKPCQHALTRIAATGNAESLGSTAILLRRDGSERLVESNSSPIRDHAGRKMGVVIVLRDVTERQRIEEERQKAEKLESLGVVAGGIAHDFNNLFTAILGNLSLALGAEPSPVIAERLGVARKSTQRAQELASQLLTFAKGGAPVKQTTSLGDLLRHTIPCAISGPRVSFDFQLAADLWPVEADPTQLAQVISNLTVNAEQAMTSGGRLEIVGGNVDLVTGSVTLGLAAGRWVYFGIRDEGVGIPEQYLQKIFDPYFTTKVKGTGLGLATTYSIVKNHGGSIQVESTPGIGSTFTIYLPASDKPLQTAAEEAPAPHGTGRVLVLDDEEVICMLVTCALEPLGYEVTETQDPLSAIAKYEEAMRQGRRFDLVISDLTMPGTMGGQEAIKHLRALDPDVRAIVSSGYASDPVMSRYQDFGFSGMIAKPYEIDALGRKVAEVMAQTSRPSVIYHAFEERKIA